MYIESREDSFRIKTLKGPNNHTAVYEPFLDPS